MPVIPQGPPLLVSPRLPRWPALLGATNVSFYSKGQNQLSFLSLEKLACHRSVQRVTWRVGGGFLAWWGLGSRTRHSAPCVVPSGSPSLDIPGEAKVESELWPETPIHGKPGLPQLWPEPKGGLPGSPLAGVGHSDAPVEPGLPGCV